MIQADPQKVKEAVKEFFQKTGLPLEVKIDNLQELTIPVSVETEEPQLLIGERGQTLIEIQSLLKLFLRKQLGVQEYFYVDLDINDYKKKKAEYLKELAKSAADEVALTKKEKHLAPMSAYERRIVHMALAERSDVATESIGQGLERKVVIKAP